eukprot:scaffold38384_cov63-Phaeocystis_antarctica.AAC.2
MPALLGRASAREQRRRAPHAAPRKLLSPLAFDARDAVEAQPPAACRAPLHHATHLRAAVAAPHVATRRRRLGRSPLAAAEAP